MKFPPPGARIPPPQSPSTPSPAWAPLQPRSPRRGRRRGQSLSGRRRQRQIRCGCPGWHGEEQLTGFPWGFPLFSWWKFSAVHMKIRNLKFASVYKDRVMRQLVVLFFYRPSRQVLSCRDAQFEWLVTGGIWGWELFSNWLWVKNIGTLVTIPRNEPLRWSWLVCSPMFWGHEILLNGSKWI